MSKVQDQIAALTKHLFEQHRAEKTPMRVEETLLLVQALGSSVVDEVSLAPVHRSRALAPGMHPPPMMGPRFIPGAVEVRHSVHDRGAAMDVINRVFSDEPDPFPLEDDVPSIEATPVKKKFSRKLEP